MKAEPRIPSVPDVTNCNLYVCNVCRVLASGLHTWNRRKGKEESEVFSLSREVK